MVPLPLPFEPAPAASASLTELLPVAESQALHQAAVPAQGRLAGIWNDLAEGRLAIAGHGVDSTQASLLLRPAVPGRRVASPAQVETLASALAGCPQKVQAFDFDLSPSTVSVQASAALHSFGLSCSARRAPLAVAMLAAVRDLGGDAWPAGTRLVRAVPRGSFELCLPRPEVLLRPRLTQVEYEVLREVVAGASCQEIGARRGRSMRTLANQLRSVSQKLGVCGRFQYIRLAVSLAVGRADATCRRSIAQPMGEPAGSTRQPLAPPGVASAPE
jgi:DNA-binding CsgD family transcriptional regulator